MSAARTAIALWCLTASGAAAQEPALRVEVSLAPFAFHGPILTRPQSSVLITVQVTHPPATESLDEKVGVIINVFTARGKHVTDVHHKLDVKASTSGQPLVYQIVSRVDLEPGRYRFRVGAGTSDGKTGATTAEIEVPRFPKEGLATSGVVLTVSPPIFAAQVSGAKELLAVAPTAEREFTAAQQVSAVVRAYRFGLRPPGSVRVSATVVDARNATVFAVQQEIDDAAFRTFFAGRWADHTIALPIATLPPGDYLLRVSVSAGRSHSASPPIPFSVVSTRR